jgi:hypothetical protein
MTGLTLRKTKAPIVCGAFESEFLITDDKDDDGNNNNNNNNNNNVRKINGLMWLGVVVVNGDCLLFEP